MMRLWQVLTALLCPGVLSQTFRPHVITVLIDDLGWNDVGFHGSDQISTPNIDALAYSGMILNRHYVLPTCTPSRSALLTGAHPIRTGLHGYPLRGGENRSLPLTFQIAPEHFKRLGYSTHLVGKWHLGYQTYEHTPNHRGFDSFFGYYNGYIDYYKYGYNQSLMIQDVETYFYGYDLHLNDAIFRPDETVYATRLFTQKAEEIILDHDPNKPLYLYFAQLATHTGQDEDAGMEVPDDVDVNGTYPHIKHYGRKLFAGCMKELDNSIGTIVEALNKKKMLEDSIILVVSDNGAHTVSVDMAPNWGSNWPLAGTKFTMYEGGIRGAGLIWSPLLPKGVVNDNFLHITDWLPTLYSAAGGDVRDLGPVDGIDQWKALGDTSSVRRQNLLVNIDEKTQSEAVIVNNRWKVIKGGYPNYAHYDLHWGREENVEASPPYDFEAVARCPAGRTIRSLRGYEDTFSPITATELRRRSTVRCQPPPPEVAVTNGFVEKSNNFRCKNYCVFDLIKDPCEMNEVQNDEILRVGVRALDLYRLKIYSQGSTRVDPDSNPDFFGGAWMPWSVPTYCRSVAEDFTHGYKCLSVFLTLTWYVLKYA